MSSRTTLKSSTALSVKSASGSTSSVVPKTGSSSPSVYRSGWKMFACGSWEGSVSSAWTVHPISQAKNAGSPTSITHRWAA